MRSTLIGIVALFLTCFRPHGLAQEAPPVAEQSTELEDATALEFLKFVADGYRANRERAREIVAEGTIVHRETRTAQGEPRLDSELLIDFRYWQLGEHRVRCDRVWRRTKQPEGEEVRTMVHLRNPEYSFRYGGGRNPAMLRRPDVWDLDMYVFANLTQLMGNRKYRDPAAACERFAKAIENGFEPEIHLTVREENAGNGKILHLELRKGQHQGPANYEFWLDPERGFMPVRSLTRFGDENYSETWERTLDLRQSDGVWFPLGGKIEAKSTRQGHTEATREVAIAVEALRINDGSLVDNEGFFTLQAVKLPPGHTVLDRRLTHHVPYTYGQCTIEEPLLRGLLRAPGDKPLLGDVGAFRVPDLGEMYFTWKSLCGATSLWAILRESGDDIPISEVLAHCPAKAEGHSFAELAEVARAYGYDAKPVKTNLPWLKTTIRREACCAILHLNERHFVAVLGVDDARFDVADYPSQRKWVMADELEKQWAGLALLISKTPLSLGTQAPRSAPWHAYFFTVLASLCALTLGARFWCTATRTRRS